MHFNNLKTIPNIPSLFFISFGRIFLFLWGGERGPINSAVFAVSVFGGIGGRSWAFAEAAAAGAYFKQRVPSAVFAFFNPLSQQNHIRFPNRITSAFIRFFLTF